MNEQPQRKESRLKCYDYSQNGAYFVTVCTHNRLNILSSVGRGDPCGRPPVNLTEAGKRTQECIAKVEELYDVVFEQYVIMPNHVHIIIRIPQRRATARVAPTLGRIVGAFKSLSANACRAVLPEGMKLWQRSYYDHVIRNEADYLDVCRYIEGNPARWSEDELYNE